MSTIAEKVPKIVRQMEEQKRIYHAPPSSNATGSIGPSVRKRAAAEQKWDDLYGNLVRMCAELFREVGGEEAWSILDWDLAKARTKWGAEHNLLKQSSTFLRAILFAAPSSEGR